ncbi:hypothetical protein HMPREF1051_3169 [Neisseria sicca VK64]|uniref:Uncharacterized protein n=1 Tax=Neisseria sicca VK64 TaxID=1095748 RepID=I2NVG1_NEISI|nr:hypothetical protein HMPREF1051_3169 [Neisseria sicca VK64]
MSYGEATLYWFKVNPLYFENSMTQREDYNKQQTANKL